MSLFADSDTAERAIGRLEDLGGLALGDWLSTALVDNADPDRALTNLERWLRATSDPSLFLRQIVGMPRLGSLLLSILGASQPIADALIQNPELSSLVLEPGELNRIPTTGAIVSEGRRLLTRVTSYSHALDRLRYLKQRWFLPLVLNDLSGRWEQSSVWAALSDIADALIVLACELAWKDMAERRGLEGPCPVMVVAFGKLAGRELNYSSDVDLVYVIPDKLDEPFERDCARFCEALGRAMSEKMGRGSLYRVDLRLRPYGGAGPIVRSMRSVEAYYRLYAEPWEQQALLRSRPVVGPQDLVDRWTAMRDEQSFRPNLSDVTIEQLLAMKRRIEEGAVEDDLKRAEGGIRDVEFYVQVLQMVHGHQRPELRALNTVEVLDRLAHASLIDATTRSALVDGYTFLRKLEHRLQLVGDRQTHALPTSSTARESLAKTMGYGRWSELESALQRNRRTISSLYRSKFHPDEESQGPRSEIRKSLGRYATSVVQWFDVFPENDAFYELLLENEGSLHRVRTILSAAPKLVTFFRSSLSLTEMLMSGEIEEETDLPGRIDRLPLTAYPQQVAEAHVSSRTIAVTRWVLSGHADLAADLTAIQDALLRHIVRRLSADIDVIALGSYGMGATGSGSDVDLLMLVPTKEQHPDAEIKAQELVSFINSLHRLGARIKLDLRLRPEGGKGLLVRTYEGFNSYELHDMEMWERFALGEARLVTGRPEALALVQHAAYSVPLTPERLRDLAKMKKRIETERVQPQHAKRHVKLGQGGLNDIEWLVHLHEMRYPSATRAGWTTNMPDRIRTLGQCRLLNTVETELLIEAQDHLLRVRNYIDLQDLDDDLVPENPDKLDRLAHALGDRDGHDFLRRHGVMIEGVRRLYNESMERLRI